MQFRYSTLWKKHSFTKLITVLFTLLFFSTSLHAALVDKLKEHKTSLRCEDLKVSLLLRGIGRQGGINIFVADEIKDSITIDMDGLSLYEAFHFILDAKRLSYTEKNNVIIIEKLSSSETGIKNLQTKRICTEYGNAATYVPQLKPLLSSNGKLTASNRGNCLIVQDLPTHINRISQMLVELDQPIPQVHIEAKIVTVSNEAKKSLGINWDYNNLDTKDSLSAVSDLSVTSATTATIGFLRDNLDLTIDIQAMQEKNMLKILSSPNILVLDGKEAEIKSGQEVPYVTQSGDNLNTTFREATLSLKVTPKIIKNDYIVLDVVVTNDSVDLSEDPDVAPLINKQEISTNLFLENGLTVVIGGILLETIDSKTERVPILSYIPVIGWFFRNSQKIKDRSELLVFITPTIVQMNPSHDKGSAGGPILMEQPDADKMTSMSETR